PRPYPHPPSFPTRRSSDLRAPGHSWHESQERPRSLAEFRDQIREVVRQGLVDIMLMSASSHEILCLEERLFESSPVTAAVRANEDRKSTRLNSSHEWISYA